MAFRPALVFGSDGLPQQLQSGDVLVGGQPNLVVNPASPYPASNYDDVWCSTAAAAQTIALPASPTNGMVVGGMRNGANTLTMAANGKTIAGSATDFIIDRDKCGVWCTWDATAATWQVEPRTRA